ncbi:MAG TPA: hypothetical protein VLA16_10335 [Ideonella sp.]|nr:hypothetical protein [Ideonella sp.]
MAEFELPSTETLRRNALTRSQQRNAQVARRRIAGRWVLWTLGLLLRWVVLPALLVASLLWAFRHDNASPEPGTGQPAARPASDAAPRPSKRVLQLRLDEDEIVQRRSPRAAPQAQSGASPIADDRSSRER